MQCVIAYTDRLWRSLVRPPRVRHRISTPTTGRLAPWCATVTRGEDRNYAIAIAAHSGLTLVFEAATVEDFKAAMIAALQGALEDLGIPEHALASETSDIGAACFERLHDPDARSELDYVEFISGTEFPYHDDARRVQLNLNQLPRGNRSPCVPREAVRLLFGSRSGEARIGL
jgi:hypothetical protein